MSQATFERTPGVAGVPVVTRFGISTTGTYLTRTDTPTLDSIDQAEAWYRKQLEWTPPKGHASWCVLQLHPYWRPFPSAPTPMAKPTCTCAKNGTARRLRKLAAMAVLA